MIDLSWAWPLLQEIGSSVLSGVATAAALWLCAAWYTRHQNNLMECAIRASFRGCSHIEGLDYVGLGFENRTDIDLTIRNVSLFTEPVDAIERAKPERPSNRVYLNYRGPKGQSSRELDSSGGDERGYRLLPAFCGGVWGMDMNGIRQCARHEKCAHRYANCRIVLHYQSVWQRPRILEIDLPREVNPECFFNCVLEGRITEVKMPSGPPQNPGPIGGAPRKVTV